MIPPTVNRAEALGNARALKTELAARLLPGTANREARAALKGVADAVAGGPLLRGNSMRSEAEPVRPSLLDDLHPTILGIGFGAKQAGGASVFDELAVRVYVRAKLPKRSLSEAELVPGDVNGTPTDVIAVGDIVAVQAMTESGVSCGHPRAGAGTLGCVVRKRGGNPAERYILSNNHVLAAVNQGRAGDPILFPSPQDWPTPATIAQLTDFQPLDFNGPNAIDAAIARLHDPGSVAPAIRIIGPVAPPPGPPAVYQSVRKHGRTTQHTVGVIMDLAADIRVGYGTRSAAFVDQLAITGVGGNFGQRGDSGSLVVDAVRRTPVGLLFAVGGTTTFANWIDPVLDRFGIEIL